MITIECILLSAIGCFFCGYTKFSLCDYYIGGYHRVSICDYHWVSIGSYHVLSIRDYHTVSIGVYDCDMSLVYGIYGYMALGV